MEEQSDDDTQPKLPEFKPHKYRKFRKVKKAIRDHLCQPVDIANYNQFLMFEDPIQLRTDIVIPGVDFIQQMVLSATITDEQISDHKLKLCDDSLVTTSEKAGRLRRNTFIIESVQTERVREPVLYGEDVYIRLADSGTSRTLYLKFVIPTLECFGGNRERFYVKLSETKNKFCKFRILHYDLPAQDALDGFPVPSNTRISIKHIVTNKYLACENEYTFDSVMGTEKLASGYNYINIYDRLRSCHFWICVTKLIGEKEYVYEVKFPEEEEKSDDDDSPDASTSTTTS